MILSTILVLTAALPGATEETDPLAALKAGDKFPWEQTYSEGGAPEEVRVTLDNTQVTLADKVKLTFEIKSTAPRRLLEDDFDIQMTPEAFMGAFLNDTQGFRDRKTEGDVTTITYVVELEPLIGGEYPLGPFVVGFTSRQDGDDKSGQVAPEHTITIENVGPVNVLSTLDLTAMPELRPVGSAVSVTPPWQWPTWLSLLIAGVVLLGGGGAFGWFWWKNRTRPTVEIVVPAHEWAFAALARLRDSGLLESEGPKAFYYEITAILKEYIERRFLIRAAKQTTQEFIDSLNRTTIFSVEQKQTLARFVEQTDLVKYAGEAATIEQCGELFQITSAFVQQTIPVVEAEEPDQVGGAA